jgi:hypothetical protein
MIDLTFQQLLSRGDFFPQKILNYCYKINGNSVNNRDIFKVNISVTGGHCDYSGRTQKCSYTTGCGKK